MTASLAKRIELGFALAHISCSFLSFSPDVLISLVAAPKRSTLIPF